jgi:tetratricopeptide (TPR) repeat protein
LGLLRYKEKKYGEAVAALKQATEIKPDMGEARFNLALAQMAKSNRAGAISQYRLLEESDPKLAADLYRLLYKDQILYVGGKGEQ